MRLKRAVPPHGCLRRVSGRTRTPEHHVFSKWSRRRVLWISGPLVIVALIAALFVVRGRSAVDVPQAAFSDFLHAVDTGQVSQVVISGDTLDYTRDGRAFRTIAPANYVTTNADFVPQLARKQVRIDVRNAP